MTKRISIVRGSGTISMDVADIPAEWLERLGVKVSDDPSFYDPFSRFFPPGFTALPIAMIPDGGFLSPRQLAWLRALAIAERNRVQAPSIWPAPLSLEQQLAKLLNSGPAAQSFLGDAALAPQAGSASQPAAAGAPPAQPPSQPSTTQPSIPLVPPAGFNDRLTDPGFALTAHALTSIQEKFSGYIFYKVFGFANLTQTEMNAMMGIGSYQMYPNHGIPNYPDTTALTSTSFLGNLSLSLTKSASDVDIYHELVHALQSEDNWVGGLRRDEATA
jgi:hypothetical protein